MVLAMILGMVETEGMLRIALLPGTIPQYSQTGVGCSV